MVHCTALLVFKTSRVMTCYAVNMKCGCMCFRNTLFSWRKKAGTCQVNFDMVPFF